MLIFDDIYLSGTQSSPPPFSRLYPPTCDAKRLENIHFCLGDPVYFPLKYKLKNNLVGLYSGG